MASPAGQLQARGVGNAEEHADDAPPSKRARVATAPHHQDHQPARDESPVTPAEAEAESGQAEHPQHIAPPTTAEELGEELQYDGIPQGWRQCPNMGQPMRLPFTNPISGELLKAYLVPMKVPLDYQYDDRLKDDELFYPEDALLTIATRDEYKRLPVHIVIDLTKARPGRYYDPNLAWANNNIHYEKVPCAGFGEHPRPEEVNRVLWVILDYLFKAKHHGIILIHCTHGFNRTGFMIVSALVRLAGISLEKALGAFVSTRSPGIYKQEYIRGLYKYFHVFKPKPFPSPALPEWKAGAPPSPEAPPEDVAAQGPPPVPQHDDEMGEEVPYEEALGVQRQVTLFLLGQEFVDQRGGEQRGSGFPGSQPVSLDLQSIEKLKQVRYWLTWKADGTRYMLFICRWGCYLIDRAFRVRRVQLRFPRTRPHDVPPGVPFPPFHHNTLTDGEMVVDHDKQAGTYRRRYLIYDIMVVNGYCVIDRPFSERYMMIQSELMAARTHEQDLITQDMKANKRLRINYNYQAEPFSVRRKDFWALSQADKVLHKMIPGLSHHADGLILQPVDDPYVPLTCKELLKWKFSHENSVDFLLLRHNGALTLYLKGGGKSRQADQGHPPGLTPLGGGKVVFPEGETPESYIGRIIECTYDPNSKNWVFMRERKDKNDPNAFHVYLKVFRSIEDNINTDKLLQFIGDALAMPLYAGGH